MKGIIDIQTNFKISKMCSWLGYGIIQGNVEILKMIYGTLWQENPAIIEMVSLLQDNITSVEIENDHSGVYDSEFLYYWGMICLAEQSNLVLKNIEIARCCFEKIIDIVPCAEARLAYIRLLDSSEPAKSDFNVKSIDTLRKWAGKQDLFSRIVLARIVFDRFLDEWEDKDINGASTNLCIDEMKGLCLPLKVIRLLQLPCSLGHPVAVKFWNEAVAYIGSDEDSGWKLDTARMRTDILYDYKPMQIMQIAAESAENQDLY